MCSNSIERVLSQAKKKYESPRQLERQANILLTTREMLAEVGYGATTMRGLAQRASVAPGTLYNLYKSKDELVVAAVQDLLDELGEQANARSQEGIERIMALAENTADAIQDTPQYAEAMARALFRADADHPLVSLLYARSLPFLRRHIEIAQGEGLLNTDADADLYARHLQAQAWGIIMAWVMGIMQLKDVRREYLRSQAMILLSISSAKGRRWIADYIAAL